MEEDQSGLLNNNTITRNVEIQFQKKKSKLITSSNFGWFDSLSNSVSDAQTELKIIFQKRDL
jgi:hypothetical protein